MSKNNKKFFVWIIFTLLQTLSGAEDKNFSIVPALPDDQIALRFVACHYLDDHDAICSFAKTNKAYHRYMLSLADMRKNLLIPYVDDECLGSLCNKYDSVCYRAYRLKDSNELVLTHSTLKNDTPSNTNYHHSRFISPLPYTHVPFFNDKGEPCFYGYGIARVCYIDVLTIIRYQTSKARGASGFRCFMAKRGDEIDGKQMYRRFDFCMEYPFLLKAILNSSQVTQDSDNQELVFWLDGVTVPDNYREKVPMKDLSDNWAHKNFEHLPDIIKNFIEKN